MWGRPLLLSANILKTASSVDVINPSQTNHKKVQDVIEKIKHKGNHPKVSSFLATLEDFVGGAPSPYLALAYDGSHKMVGALTFLNSNDSQEIRSLGVVDGDTTARALIRALDHRKTLSVSVNAPDQDLYRSLGFIHSEELDDEGGPSEMVKLPPGKLASVRRKWAAFHDRAWIDLKGEFHPVDGDFSGKTWGPGYDPDQFRHHEDVAAEAFPEAYDPYEHALSVGWIRVGVYDSWGYAELGGCNQPQFDALYKYLSKHMPPMVEVSGVAEGQIPIDEFLQAGNLSKLRRELRGTGRTQVTKQRNNPADKTATIIYDIEDEAGFREVKSEVEVDDPRTLKWTLTTSPSESGISADIVISLRNGKTTGTVVYGSDPQDLEQKVISVIDQWYGTRDEQTSAKVRSGLLADLAKSFRTEPNPPAKMRFPTASIGREFSLTHGEHSAAVAVQEAPEVHEEGNDIYVSCGDAYIFGESKEAWETFILHKIWVPEDLRNQGIGQALMAKLAEYLRQQGTKYIIGWEVNEEHIPGKLRNKIPNSETARLDFRGDPPDPSKPSAHDVLGDTNKELDAFLDYHTPDPDGKLLLTKIAKVISNMQWPTFNGGTMRYVMASSILAKAPLDAKEAEIPSSRVGETLWRALAFNEANRRLNSIEAGSKLRSMNEVANLKSKISELGRHPINKPEMEGLRTELIQVARTCLTEGQLKRVRLGRWAEWSRAGRKLMPLLPEDLSQAILSWGHTASLSHTSANLADLFCTNPECPDYEKRGHGNLTQEFTYGVDSDRHMLYCATCKKRFSETKCTEFFGAKLNGDDIANILKRTVEGKSIREIADELDLNKDSVNNVILKAKKICQDYISGGHADVDRDALGDMDLEKGNKGDLTAFINQVVIPSLKDDVEDDKEDTEDDKPKKDDAE